MIKKINLYLSRTCILPFLVFFLIGCSPSSATPAVPPSAIPIVEPTATEAVAGLSDEAIITLRSLEKVDNHPLFVMHYAGGYDQYQQTSLIENNIYQCWACSLFVSLGDPDQFLYGRNFDWGGIPALLQPSSNHISTKKNCKQALGIQLFQQIPIIFNVDS